MRASVLQKWLGGSRDPEPFPDRALDLAHLSRQSLGDQELERELLMLFDRQADQIAARLGSEIGAGDRRWRRDLSHTLTGSARAIGAFRVAHAAAIYEEALCSSATDRELTVLRDSLVCEVVGVRKAIRDILATG